MSNTDFAVYGMKLQPGDIEGTFEFCQSESIVGVGWGLENKSYNSISEVKATHQDVVDKRNEKGKEIQRMNKDGRLYAPIRYILKDIEKGDYVWVNEGNKFALCKVQSDWNVTPNLDKETADQYSQYGIHHFRDVEWTDISYSLVPGFIRRKFSRRYGTLKEMDDGINEKSKLVMEALHGKDESVSDSSLDRVTIANKIKNTDAKQVFDILGPDETEDIVISYLQSKGWRIIKSSTDSSQAKIECEMRREKNGGSVLGYLQVKTGSAGVDPTTYKEYAESGEMIFFVESGVDVKDHDGMSEITPGTIQDYIIDNYNYLPNESMVKFDFMLD